MIWQLQVGAADDRWISWRIVLESRASYHVNLLGTCMPYTLGKLEFSYQVHQDTVSMHCFTVTHELG